MNKGSYGVAMLYVSLIESSEQLHGLPAHYQLAGELKQIGTYLHVHCTCMCSNSLGEHLHHEKYRPIAAAVIFP